MFPQHLARSKQILNFRRCYTNSTVRTTYVIHTYIKYFSSIKAFYKYILDHTLRGTVEPLLFEPRLSGHLCYLDKKA